VKLIAIIKYEMLTEGLGKLPPLLLNVCDSYWKFYSFQGFAPPWTGYLAEQEGLIVGICGFKGAPVDNRVEIYYFTVGNQQK
jgi:hypothetical protein